MGEVKSTHAYSVTFEFWLLAFLVVIEAVWVGFLGSLLFGYHMIVTEVVLLSVTGYIGCRREQFFEMLTDRFRKKRKG